MVGLGSARWALGRVDIYWWFGVGLIGCGGLVVQQGLSRYYSCCCHVGRNCGVNWLFGVDLIGVDVADAVV